MDDKTPEQLAAELALLREYDRLRRVKGHDYGNGQRAGELSRRQRELESQCWAGGSSAYELERDAPKEALLAAFNRVGKARYKRAVQDATQYRTPSARRTLDSWRTIASWVGASV